MGFWGASMRQTASGSLFAGVGVNTPVLSESSAGTGVTVAGVPVMAMDWLLLVAAVGVSDRSYVPPPPPPPTVAAVEV